MAKSDPTPPATEPTAEPKTTVPVCSSDARPKRRRWLRRVGWTSLALVVIAIIGAVVVTRPFVLTPLLSWQLSSALGVDVSINRAEWSWDGRVDLIAVRVDLAAEAAHPDTPGAGSVNAEPGFDRLIDADRIAVSLSPGGWLAGRGMLDSIEIEGPVLRVVEDAATGEVNLRQWLAAGDREEMEEEPQAAGIPALPRAVHLSNGRIVVERRGGDMPTTTLADVPIAGRFEPMTDQPGTQRFVLEQTGGGQAGEDVTPRVSPLRIEGTIARQPAKIELRIDDFDVSQPLGVLAPPTARAFWDELAPAGALPTLTARFEHVEPATGTAGSPGLRLVEAELVLEGLSFSVPLSALGVEPAEVLDEDGLSSAESAEDLPYDLRMTDVNGRFVLANDKVRVEDLTGLIEGVRYYVKGEIGLSETPDSGGAGATKLQLHTDPFTLDEDPPFIIRLPRPVRNLYGEYRPRGDFRATTILERRPGAAMRVSGAVEVLGAEATYHQFTYPLQDVTGAITFDEDGLAFESLTAQGPTGGRVAILGQVTNPGDNAKADVTLELTSIPVDEHLFGALNAKAQRAIQMFLDDEELIAMREAGLIASVPNGEDSNASNAYAFDLDNRLDGVVRIVRDLTVAPKSQVQTRIDATGMKVLFEFFPYPLTLSGGAIVVEQERIGIESLELRGPAGASAVVVGELTRADPQADFVPDLTVRDMVVPVTDNLYLLNALPGVAREWFESFVLTGETQGTVRVTGNDELDAKDDVAWRVEGELTKGTARPFGGDFLVTGLTGGFAVDRGQTELIGLNGRRGAAVLDVSANIQHRNDFDACTDEAEEDTPLGVTLTAKATNLAIEPAAKNLVPPNLPARQQLAELFEAYAPSGSTDVNVALDVAAGKVKVLLRPRMISLTHRGSRFALTNMTGPAAVFTDHVRFDEVRGDIPAEQGGGFATIDGVLGLGGTADTALGFTGQATPDGPLARAALPEAATRALDGLVLTGPVTIESSRLSIRPEPGDGPATSFEAFVRFNDNTADLGTPITELTGTLDTNYRVYADGRPASLKMTLDAPSLRASERRIDDVAANFNNAADADWLEIEDFVALVYGGALTATGGVPLDGNGAYRVVLRLQDAALGPILDPTDEDAWDAAAAGEPRDVSTGLVSAELRLDADPSRPDDTRRGSGAITVRDAELFARRNSIAVLRVLNFALPSRAALNEAIIDFTLGGGTVGFRRIELSGPGLIVTGTGTMTWPDTALDLLLTTRNAEAPTFGILTDVFNALKDELVGIRVTGTVAEPSASLTTLSGTRRKAGELLEPILPPSTEGPRSPVIEPNAPDDAEAKTP